MSQTRSMFAVLVALIASPLFAGQANDRAPEGPAGAPDAAKAREWLARAEALAKQNEPKPAREAAEKAEALAGDDPGVIQDLANFYATRLKDYPKAAALGARYAERNPSDAGAWRRLASFCLATDQPEQAIAAGLRALAAGDDAELHKLLGTAYAQKKDWGNGATEFTKAVALNRYDEDAHFRLAQVHLFTQDFAAAVAALENARKTFDRSPQLELAFGVAHYGLRNFAQAVDQFLRTIQLAPDVAQPYVFLGRILENANERLPEIIQAFEQFETRNPNSHLGYLLHAKALIQELPPAEFTPQAEKALDLTKRALSLKEDDAEAHLQIGILLERKKDYPEAATHLERSVHLNHRDPAVHYHLARVYDRLGRKEDAARERAEHAKLNEQVQAGAAMDPTIAPAAGAKK